MKKRFFEATVRGVCKTGSPERDEKEVAMGDATAQCAVGGPREALGDGEVILWPPPKKMRGKTKEEHPNIA